MESKDVKMTPPWIEYANQVEAFFKRDKDVNVEYDDENKVLTLRVVGEEKADALDQLLPGQVLFGNVALKVNVIPANEVGVKSVELFRKAFDGNPIVSEITPVDTLWGTINFIVFKPEVVQYYNDAMFDLNGIRTTVYQELARDIFGMNDGIFYCTEKIIE